MKKITPLLLFLAFAWCVKAQGTLLDAQFVHDDSMRTYKLYVPAAYDGSEAWPLVIALHGFGLDADFMIALTGMNEVADTGHFLVAYPQGLMITEELVLPPLPATGTGWNLGNFEVSDNDDVGFLNKMIHKIGLSHRVDPARVYACGLSNGGSMVYRLACELSDRIAAVASVSGGAAADVPCSPARPVPLLEIHGTADPFNPYDGIPDFLTPIPEGINFWVNNNQCDDAPVVTQFPDVYPGDGTTVTLKKYGNCNEDAEVWLMDVLGGGHLWPDPTPPFPAPPFLGPQNGDIDGSTEIWNFFKKFEHPNPVTTARVQFIHAAGHETVKLVGNGETLREVFAYQTATPFMDVPAGAPLDLDVVVRDPWSPAPNEHFPLDFTPGETYVVLLKGTFDLNDAYPVGLSTFDRGRENGSQPDMVDILSVRGGPDIPVPIDVVVVGGPKLADDVLYGEFGADYVSLPAGSFTLSPTPAGNNDIILDPFVAHMGFWKGRTAVGFGTGLVGNHTFQPWVALSNGGTFPLYPPPGSNKPQLAFGKNAGGNLKLVPNPASNYLQVQLMVTEAAASSLSLFDANGRMVLGMDLGELPVGYLPVDLDVSQLPQGIYLLKFRNGTPMATERVAVVR